MAPSFGLMRSFGVAGTAAAPSAEALGFEAGVSDSGRSRGFKRSGGGGFSSLMGVWKQVPAFRETKKIHSRSNFGLTTLVHSIMKLKQLLLLSLAALVFSFASGCHFFRKSGKPKPSPEIAAGVEADFRKRWLERREAELVAKGATAEAAHEQAQTEFREKYAYLKEEKKK